MTFLEEVWENMWKGLTPVIMVGLLILGISMARKFSSLGVSFPTVVLAYIGGCILIPLSLPIFTTLKK